MHPESAIDRLVDEGLPLDEERDVRAHLRTCAACRARYDHARSVARALMGSLDAPTPSEAAVSLRLVTDAVFPDAAKRAPRAPFMERMRLLLVWSPQRALAMAATAALALVALTALWTRDSPSTTEVAPVAVAPEIEATSEPAPAAPAATVMHATGATRSGVALRTGDTVRADERIVVDGAGALELTLVRGGALRVYAKSTLSLDARGETVALTRGKVWAIPDEGKGRFVVSTSTADVTVLGTSFVVDATAERTDVRVISGSVRVVDKGARGDVTLTKGQGTRVQRGSAPTAPAHASTRADTNEWKRFFENVLRDLERSMRILEKEISKIGE